MGCGSNWRTQADLKRWPLLSPSQALPSIASPFHLAREIRNLELYEKSLICCNIHVSVDFVAPPVPSLPGLGLRVGELMHRRPHPGPGVTLKVLGGSYARSRDRLPLHLPGFPELHRLIENHVICPPHPGYATVLQLEALLGAGNSLLVTSSERKIFPHYSKLHSAFRAPEKGSRFHFPGGGGPYSGTLIFPSVEGHADRAAGAAAEIR